jgi:hypothetical protein
MLFLPNLSLVVSYTPVRSIAGKQSVALLILHSIPRLLLPKGVPVEGFFLVAALVDCAHNQEMLRFAIHAYFFFEATTSALAICKRGIHLGTCWQ